MIRLALRFDTRSRLVVTRKQPMVQISSVGNPTLVSEIHIATETFREDGGMVEQRRRRITDSFQWRIFFRILSYGFIYQVTVWNLLFCWRLFRHDGDLITQYREFCYESYPMLLCMFVLIPAFAWDALTYCHKIAGPIYRFRATSRDIAAGIPVRRIRLRKGDELLTMQDDFNSMLDALARRGAIELIAGGENNQLPANKEAERPNESAEPALSH